MLKSISIQHFRSVENANIDLDEVTVFVGANGSGKSNLVDALRFLRDAVTNGLDRAFSDRHGVESVRQWSPTRPFQLSLEVIFSEVDYWASYGLSIDTGRGAFIITREDLDIRERKAGVLPGDDDSTERVYKTRIIAHRDKTSSVKSAVWSRLLDRTQKSCSDLSDTKSFQEHDDLRAENANDRLDLADEILLNQRSQWRFFSLRRRLSDFQAYSIFPNTLRVPQEPSNEVFLSSEGRNFASVFKRLRRQRAGVEAISQITEAMKLILPNLERISIQSLGGFLVPQFHMLESSGKRHIFNVAQMSDGTLRVLGLLTALYQEPKPAIIALEEPEQTVNPGVLTVIADSIKEVSRRSQIIITTHSPELLDEFSPEQVRAVENENGKSIVRAVSSAQISLVRDRLFSLGELLKAEGIHG